MKSKLGRLSLNGSINVGRSTLLVQLTCDSILTLLTQAETELIRDDRALEVALLERKA